MENKRKKSEVGKKGEVAAAKPVTKKKLPKNHKPIDYEVDMSSTEVEKEVADVELTPPWTTESKPSEHVEVVCTISDLKETQPMEKEPVTNIGSGKVVWGDLVNNRSTVASAPQNPLNKLTGETSQPATNEDGKVNIADLLSKLK